MEGEEIRTMNFGNWVPIKMIVLPGALGLVSLGLGFRGWPWFIPGGVLALVAVYFTVSRFVFSPKGWNLQDRIHELVMAHIEWGGRGKILDIGCGNGPLTVKLARRFPEAEVVGMDYWGKDWDYSISVCKSNAALARAEERISFQRGSASALPFADGSFDLVVSNLVFHEVRDVKDKKICVREALRVLKPGGVFVLQDLLLLEAYFGKPEELMDAVRGWGAREVEFIRTCDLPFIPALVKLPFMVGTLAILSGRK